MILAIGDIHGCRAALEKMIEITAPIPEDTVITLGDYVDRGPDSKGVIDYLLEFRKTHNLLHLKGNHECQMLDALSGKAGYHFFVTPIVGGQETIDSYGGNIDDIPDSHWDFIKSAGVVYESDTHFFVHAGSDPLTPIMQQSPEVAHWKRFYEAVPHSSGKVMVCGHTIQSDRPTNLGYSICLDTCAYGGGWLTALDVESGKYWQTNEAGQSRTGQIDDLLE